MKTVSVMIVAGVGVMRDGYQALFEAIDGLCPLTPADDVPTARARVADDKPGIIIVDSSVGLAGIRTMCMVIEKSETPSRCIVIYSKRSQLDEICHIGADAVVLEGTSPSDIAAIVKGLAGEIRRQ